MNIIISLFGFQIAYRLHIICIIIISVNDVRSVVRGCGWVKNFGTLRNRKCFSRTGTHQVSISYYIIVWSHSMIWAFFFAATAEKLILKRMFYV